jgi:hypothetical protein
MTASKKRRQHKGPDVKELVRLADSIDEDAPDYLAFLRRWGNRYSTRNLQMLWVQCPHATSLHKYEVWSKAGLQAAVDCVYTSTAGGMVTSCPVTKRTEKRVMPALRRQGRPLCADCQAARNR